MFFVTRQPALRHLLGKGIFAANLNSGEQESENDSEAGGAFSWEIHKTTTTRLRL
jgi:hypothetical protein